MSKNRDILITCCALILSIGAGLYAYKLLLKEDGRSTFLFGSLPTEDRAFDVYSGESCIGNFSYTFTEEAGIGLLATGAISTANQGVSGTTRFVTEVTFNQLNQLATSETRILSDYSDLYISSLNINPISFEFSGHINDFAQARQFNVPGPVTLHSNRDGSYQLQNRRITGNLGTHFRTFIDYLFKDLEVEVRQASEEGCLPEDHLEISPLIKKIEHVLQVGAAFTQTLKEN